MGRKVKNCGENVGGKPSPSSQCSSLNERGLFSRVDRLNLFHVVIIILIIQIPKPLSQVL